MSLLEVLQEKATVIFDDGCFLRGETNFYLNVGYYNGEAYESWGLWELNEAGLLKALNDIKEFREEMVETQKILEQKREELNGQN